jgi:putative inorganic carbon (hco3(-)) transporter
MLRTIFVFTMIAIGTFYAVQSSFYALLFYIWNAYFRPEDWVWIDFIRNLNLSFTIGCFVVISTLFSGRRFVLNGRVLLIFVFLIHAFFSTIFSEHFSYSWPYWLEFLKLSVISYLMIVLIDDFKKFRIVLFVIALSLGFEGVKQGWFHLLTSPGWPNTNSISFLGDNNGVAIGMLMLVPIIVVLEQTSSRRWGRLFYWIFLVGVLYRALSTYSRGGFLACLALGCIYWLNSRFKFRSLLALIVVAAIILPTLPDTFWHRMTTIQTYEEDEDASALGRLHFWQVALDMAKAHPFLGVGFNAYNQAYDAYDFSGGRFGTMRSTHNSFLAVLSELGYVGLFLYILIILSAFRSCHRTRRAVENRSDLTYLSQSANALRMSLVVFIVGGSFLPFQYQELLWHYLSLTAVIEAIAISETSEPAHQLHPQLALSPARGYANP